MYGDKWVPDKSHALGSGNLQKWLSILWSNYGHEYLPSPIERALASHPRRVRHYSVHFTAVTIARSVPTADLLLSQVKLGSYREGQSWIMVFSSLMSPFHIVAALQTSDYHISHRPWCCVSRCKRRLARPKQKVNNVPNRADIKYRRHMGHVEQIRHVRR